MQSVAIHAYGCMLFPVLCHIYFSVGGSAQECVKSISLKYLPLDVLCDVVGIFEHVKELQCVDIDNPLEVCQPYASVCALFLLHPCHTCT